MESIPRNEILEFNDDTLSYLRKFHNFDKPGEMDAAIDLLDDWVKKQPHFINKEYSREYLERAIMLSKGSVERAKKQMERLSTLKTLLPHMFQKYDVKNDYKDFNGKLIQGLIPKLTPDHYRVFALKFVRSDILTTKTLADFYKHGILFCEYAKVHDYFNGVIGIIDYRSVSLPEILSVFNIFDLMEAASTILEGYAARIQGIHFISNSKSMEIVLGIAKKILGSKVRERVHHHRNVETLYKFVPKHILPVEFGGTERSLEKISDEWTELLSSKENCEYLKKVSKYGTDEKYRDKAKFNEMYMGMSGSFRHLHVD